MCPSCGHWRKIQQYFGLAKTFLVFRSLPRLGLRATCWNYKISQCVVLKTKRQAIIKNQNKIFHSHWDKRHKFPLRIDPFAARQTIQKKKNLVMLRGCPQFLSFSGALAAQGDYVWQPTWDKCLDTGHYGTWVLSAKLELDVSKLASVLWFIGLS